MKGILPFATAWMDPENAMLSDEKDKHHMILLTGGI